MPIAKEQLKIGFTVAANPGAYVTQAAVDEYGWGDKVDKGKDYVEGETGTAPRKTTTATTTTAKAKATE